MTYTNPGNNDYIVELRDLRSARTECTLAVLDTRSPCTDYFQKWYYFSFPSLLFWSFPALLLMMSLYSCLVIAEVPRTILALYKSSESTTGVKEHPLHKFLEMPLNHLGMKVVYWDIEKGLPQTTTLPALRGIVSWFYTGDMAEPEHYLTWAMQQMSEGKKLLVIQNIGAYEDKKKRRVSSHIINNFLSYFKLQHCGNWIPIEPTMTLRVSENENVNFEDKTFFLPKGVDGYERLLSEDQPFIAIEMNHRIIPVAVISQYGGVFQEGYFIRIVPNTQYARWFVNPFTILEKIFNAADLPKPDVTTLSGKRIYFSHIDGEGWQRKSHIFDYAKASKTCAEVIYDNVIVPFSDLPVTVAPIAAELDPEWEGTVESQLLARRMFSAPHVQVASNTYSYPVLWEYYDTDNPAAKEEKDYKKTQTEDEIESLDRYYRPRLYMKKPFNLENEILGSIHYIQNFLPLGKSVDSLHWSGNCAPFAKALKVLSGPQHYANINGGNPRLDNDFPTYSAVCSVGRDVEGCIQIYAAGSDENSYTEGWTKKFFAFQYLINTFMRTESPLRVKPLNLYYHMYSGEKISSLMALLRNLDYINQANISPVKSAEYAKIGEGFFSVHFDELAPLSWRVTNRGALQTIRFDHASDKQVDFSASQGVLGAQHFQGSLYVALDAAESSPLISLKQGDISHAPPVAVMKPYLFSSRYRISNMAYENNVLTFTADGFGHMDMKWIMPEKGKYRVRAFTQNPVVDYFEVDDEGQLKINFFFKVSGPLQFEIMKEEQI